MTRTPGPQPEPGAWNFGSFEPTPDDPATTGTPDPRAQLAEAWIAAGAERSRVWYEARWPPRSENEAKAYQYLRAIDEDRTRLAEVQAEEVIPGRWPREQACPEAQRILDAYHARATAEPEPEAEP